MSATTRDVIPETGETSPRLELPGIDDPTEDLANEVTSELVSPQRAQVTGSVPIGHGISEIDPIGRTPPIAIGSVLRDRYVLERLLASGGTSLIFRAHDLRRDALTAGGPRVAVKLLRPELRHRPHHIARLQREYRQTQGLSHPGVVRFYDLDCERGVWFIVMELLSGETLGPRLRRCGRAAMPMAEIISIGTRAAETLAHAHERGVVHGDVKPDNLFITRTGGVRLLDFGVAPELPVAGNGAATADEPVGAAATRAYASPQVLEGARPVPADDVFSLACVIQEMSAGRHPWGRRGANEARALGLSPERPARLSESQWSVVSAALSWTRDARPAMPALLACLCDERAPQPPAPTAVAAPVSAALPAPAGRRPRWLRLDAAVGAVAVAFLLGLAISRVSQEPRVLAPVAVPTAPAQADAPPPAVDEPARFIPEPAPAMTALAATIPPQPLVELPVAAESRPGFVAFESDALAVSSRAVVAAIPVRHFTDGPRSVEVGWRVLEGSARAGRDFEGPLSGVARFAEGHTFRVIYVPITIHPGTIGERTFAVELTQASGGAGLGAMRRVLVTILDDA
jgi:hypothetical protein